MSGKSTRSKQERAIWKRYRFGFLDELFKVLWNFVPDHSNVTSNMNILGKVFEFYNAERNKYPRNGSWPKNGYCWNSFNERNKVMILDSDYTVRNVAEIYVTYLWFLIFEANRSCSVTLTRISAWPRAFSSIEFLLIGNIIDHLLKPQW